MACAIPGNVSKCAALQTYSIGGTEYVTLELCDNNGKLLAVYELCNGAITGTPTYYDLAGAAYTPVGSPHSCDLGDFEQFVFCDTATDPPTPFISRVRWDENGDLVPEQTGTYELDGLTPYTPTGAVTVCGGDVVDTEFVGPLCEKDAAGNTVGTVWHKIFYRGQTKIGAALAGYKASAATTWVDPYVLGAGNTIVNCSEEGTSDVVKTCADAAKQAIGYGANLLSNGDLNQSLGVGATSAPTVGWTTGYTPVNNIYAGGAGTYGLFSTNAGALTAGDPVASAILAQGDRSLVVNVGPNTATPILSWANIYLENGKDYALEIDAAILNNPFALAVRVDGVQVVALTAPVTTGKWERTSTVFTWSGSSGFHTVSINSNSALAAGNDHALDNVSLRKAFASQTETLTKESYSDTVRAIVDQIVKIAGCNDDRRDTLLAEISTLLSNQNPSQIDVVCRCDDTDADGIFESSYKQIVSISPEGVVTILANYNQSLSAKYTPVSPGDCSVPGDNLVAARPRYKVLTGVGTWVLGADSALPTSSVAVSVIAVGNVAMPPTVTDVGGTSPLFVGLSLSWSAQFPRDIAGLRTPLVFTSHVGDVLAISWIEEVT